MSKVLFDPRDRELCVDGACIGLVGMNGHCKECGKPGASARLDPRQRGLRDESEVADQLEANIIAGDSLAAPAGFERRELCSDGGCIGIIGPDGRCKECGQPSPPRAKAGGTSGASERAASAADDRDDDDAWDDGDDDRDDGDDWDDDGDDDDDVWDDDDDDRDDGDRDDDDDDDRDDGDGDDDDDEQGEAGFDERELCPDGGCIGLIGADGRCGECGRARDDIEA